MGFGATIQLDFMWHVAKSYMYIMLHILVLSDHLFQFKVFFHNLYSEKSPNQNIDKLSFFSGSTYVSLLISYAIYVDGCSWYSGRLWLEHIYRFDSFSSRSQYWHAQNGQKKCSEWTLRESTRDIQYIHVHVYGA